MAVNNSSSPLNNLKKEKSERWYFTKDQLESTPSRKAGYDAHKELLYRQQAANFIQNMGQRLKVSQLCINTAIVYMHRFYVYHSFTHFPWHQMAAASLFLAAKVEEQPRKLEYVIRIANACRNPNNKDTAIDINSERYLAQSQDLVFNENVLLQTLGFDVAIDHPHTYVVRCCHLVRASKDLAQTSYFMASNSLHLTTMCLQYKPTVVACFCIHVACKWSNWEIPLSSEDKEWFQYVDPTVTAELLQQLTKEFLVIFESCPSKLKEKIMAIEDNPMAGHPVTTSTLFDPEAKKINVQEHKDPHRTQHESKSDVDLHKHRTSRPYDSSSSNSQHQREREYREKKEREQRERERLAMHGSKVLPPSSSQTIAKPTIPHGHHRTPVDPKLKMHSRPSSASSSSSSYQHSSRVEPRDILRDSARDSPFGLASKELKDRDHKDSSVRSDKDLQKQRDYLVKPNLTDSNSVNNFSDIRASNYNSDRLKLDPNRPSRPSDPNRLPSSSKHDAVRRHDEPKPYLKSEMEIKKHLTGVQDKSNPYLLKPSNSTSQKAKSPLSADVLKSVPKSSSSSSNSLMKPYQSSSSSTSNTAYTSSHNITVIKTEDEPQMKSEPLIREQSYIKEEKIIKEQTIENYPVQPPKRSLFSPDKSPPQLNVHFTGNEIKTTQIKSELTSPVMTAVVSPLIKSELTSPPVTSVSPLSSPTSSKKRNCSTSSEPELRPVIQKIDQMEGFETLMRDSSIGIDKLQNYSNIVKTEKIEKEISQVDSKSFDGSFSNTDSGISSQGIINGIETTPILISSLLKESSVSMPPVCSNMNPGTVPVILPTEEKPNKDHHHHKSKKKNKEKHKHKDRSKEEKEKKKKHKDKDKEKHKHKEKHEKHEKHEISSQPIVAEPIKIKIQKDKIQPVVPAPEIQSTGLKIKIPKDKIKTEVIGEPLYTPITQSGSLKIKISKDVINSCSVSMDAISNSSGKKRERDRSLPGEAPPAKIFKSSYKDKESKQNGKHSLNKVAQLGDGETSLHRLAESKYTKGSS